MKNKKILLFLLWSLLTNLITFSQTPANDPHWQLKWEDNFNTYDNSKWRKANYAIHESEPQLYLADQIWTGGGNLIIECNNIPIECPTNPPTYNWVCDTCIKGKTYKYRSGLIWTENSYNTQFGYIEARMKLPWRRAGNKTWGLFPAFWTMLNVSPGTTASEIDIFEMFAGEYNEPNTLNTCIHRCYKGNIPPHAYPNCNNGDQSRPQTLSNFNYTSYHTYAIEWNKDRLVWYVDGNVIRTTTNHLIIDPIRIILNLSIQPESKYHPPTSPTFKEYMYVDYVKVYNLKCDKLTVVNEISNFNTYNYAVKKSISLSGTTTIPKNSNITLRATDFIELKAGFFIDTNRELYLDVTPCQ